LNKNIDRRWTQINAEGTNQICVHQRLSAVKTCGCGFAASGSSVAKQAVLVAFRRLAKHQLLLVMQQILAFPVSFVDTARASVRFGSLHFGGIPRAKLKAQLF